MIDDQLRSRIKRYVLAEFLPGEAEENLTSDVKLVSEGIIDSLGSLRLVAFLEETFGVTIPAHQIDADHLDTVELIAATVQANMRELVAV